MKLQQMFSAYNPHLQVKWDATSLAALKTCPRKYQLSILEAWRPNETALPLTFGVSFHLAIEVFLKAQANGKSFDQAQLLALESALTFTTTGTVPDTKRNLFTLARGVVWWTQHHKDDPFKTLVLNKKPAVELTFSFDSGIKNSHNEPIVLCGHMDRVATLGDDLWVIDLKTTAQQLNERYFNQFTPDGQVSMYAYAAQVIFKKKSKGVMIDGVQLLVNSNAFQRAPIYRTEDQAQEWFKELPQWLAAAETYANTDTYPMNDRACFMCEFRQVCSAQPQNRRRLLESLYRKQQWDTTEVR